MEYVTSPLGQFVALVIAFALGYVGRKYVEKKWPNEAALVDAMATRYGREAAADIEDAVKKVKAKLGR